MDKKIKHIGAKSGKLLLFGGVYGNLQALEKQELLPVIHGSDGGEETHLLQPLD